MNVKINGWNCQMSVREFAELAAMMKAPETAPELPGVEAEKPELPKCNALGGLKSVMALKMESGEHLYFAHVGDIAAHFPELKGYEALGGFSAPNAAEYVRKQARKLYSRLNPENRFVELMRYTTNNKCITAVMKDGGRRVAIEVSEVA